MFSDKQIIEFIAENLKNEDALTEFFSQLEQPLSPQILTWKRLLTESGRSCNFLSFSIKLSCFKRICELSTLDALHAALLEEGVNSESPHPIHNIIAGSIKFNKTQEVLELIEKVDSEVLNIIFKREYKEWTPLILTLSTDDDFFLALLHKIDKKVINTVMKIGNAARIFGAFMAQGGSNKIQSFLPLLEVETADFLMAQPFTINGNIYPSAFFIFMLPNNPILNPNKMDHMLEWIEKLSPGFLNSILNVEFQGSTVLTLAMAMDTLVFNALLKKVNQTALNVAVKMTGREKIVHQFISEGTSDKMKYFLSLLETETVDFLMSHPITTARNSYPNGFALIAYLKASSSESLIDNLNLLLARMSPEALTSLTKYPLRTFSNGSPCPLLMSLVTLQSSQKSINAILSSLDKKFIEDILWNELLDGLSFLRYIDAIISKAKPGFVRSMFSKKIDNEKDIQEITRAAIDILHYISPAVLFKSIGQPAWCLASDNPLSYFNDRPAGEVETVENITEEEWRNGFFIQISQSVPCIFNFIVDRLLSARYHLILPNQSVDSLNKLNLDRYLTQASEGSVEALVSRQRKFSLLNADRKAMTLNKLIEANNVKKPSIEAYICLTTLYKMTESVTKIVLEYMIDDSVTNDAIIQGITCGKFLPVSAGLANEVTINKMKKSLSAWGELPSERFPVSFHWKIQKSDGHKNLILQAKMYGYTCNSVKCTKDDKNGFLHAIADQLHQWSLSYLGSEPSILRSNVEHYIMNNLEEYKNILEQNSDVLPNDCMILALSRALNVTIVIIRSDGSDPQVYNQKPPVPIICIGYDCDSFCYRSFTHVAEIKSTKKLQTIIDATPIDAGPKKVVNKRAIETKTYQP